MSFEINYTLIPDDITDNFAHWCGRDSDDIEEEEYNLKRDIELKKFKCERYYNEFNVLVYRFESRAHYNWFIIRWSS